MHRRHFLKAVIGSSVAVAIGQASGLAPLFGRAAAQNGDQQRTVNTDRLNVRAGAGLSNSVVAVLSYGDIVSIAGGTKWADGYEWVEIAVWGTSINGWVAAQYLSTGSEIPQDRVQVADGPLNVRAEPSLGAEVYFTAPTGAYGTIMDPNFVEADGYTWVCVQLDDSGVIGWMALEYLSYIDVA